MVLQIKKTNFLNCPQYGNVAQIKVGTYTGNGAATQAITGIGFQPDALFIVPHVIGSTRAWVKTAAMGTRAKAIFDNGWYENDFIISLDADGFTVGDGTPIAVNELNTNTVVYSYIALKEP